MQHGHMRLCFRMLHHHHHGSDSKIFEHLLIVAISSRNQTVSVHATEPSGNISSMEAQIITMQKPKYFFLGADSGRGILICCKGECVHKALHERRLVDVPA